MYNIHQSLLGILEVSELTLTLMESTVKVDREWGAPVNEGSLI